MKGTGLTAVAAILTLALSVPALASPKLQTYAVGAAYQSNYLDNTLDTWLTRSSNFDLNVVGTWGSSWSNRPLTPAYNWFAFGDVRGESGGVTVNGVRLTALNTQAPGTTMSLFNSPIGDMTLSYHVGAVTDGLGSSIVSYGGEVINDGDIEAMNWDPGEGRRHRRRGGGGGGATPNPEPGTLTLLGAGLLGLVPILRRKRKQK